MILSLGLQTFSKSVYHRGIPKPCSISLVGQGLERHESTEVTVFVKDRKNCFPVCFSVVMFLQKISL